VLSGFELKEHTGTSWLWKCLETIVVCHPLTGLPASPRWHSPYREYPH